MPATAFKRRCAPVELVVLHLCQAIDVRAWSCAGSKHAM